MDGVRADMRAVDLTKEDVEDRRRWKRMIRCVAIRSGNRKKRKRKFHDKYKKHPLILISKHVNAYFRFILGQNQPPKTLVTNTRYILQNNLLWAI